MTKFHNYYVLLWSPSQQVFHQERLEATMTVGIEAYITGQLRQDYIVLCMADTRAELNEFKAEIMSRKREYKDSEQGGASDGDNAVN